MINNQLTSFLGQLKTDLINSLQANGKDASAQTAKQLTITTGEDSAQLELPGYMKLLETGRGPTHPGAAPGNPPMILRIQQWCQERGIPAKAAWAIKKSIDKKGFKGVPGLLTEPLGNDNINASLHPLLEELAQEIIKCIANESG